MDPPIFAHIMNPGNILVIQAGGRLGLVFKSLNRLRIRSLIGGKDFQRDNSGKTGVQARYTRPIPPPPTYSINLKCPR